MKEEREFILMIRDNPSGIYNYRCYIYDSEGVKLDSVGADTIWGIKSAAKAKIKSIYAKRANPTNIDLIIKVKVEV